jgi:formylglycine-generating enzyme required for sulfatase activity
MERILITSLLLVWITVAYGEKQVATGVGKITDVKDLGGPSYVVNISLDKYQGTLRGEQVTIMREQVQIAVFSATAHVGDKIVATVPKKSGVRVGDTALIGASKRELQLGVAQDKSKFSLNKGGQDANSDSGEKKIERIPEPADKTLTVDLGGGVIIEFVWIEPGTFMMGAPESEPGRGFYEGPQHIVTITQGFWLGKYEVTQAQWVAVMGSNPSLHKGVNRPVEMIYWKDVQEFISKLNQFAGAVVYRLPTEAEWEYACRAGTAMRWSFGDDKSELKEYAWYDKNDNPEGTKDVGTKKPNPWGLHDMYGNVSELCQDKRSSSYLYPSDSQIDPTGPAIGGSHVLRGGTFYGRSSQLRSASRGGVVIGYPTLFGGVRLLRIAHENDSSKQMPREMDVKIATLSAEIAKRDYKIKRLSKDYSVWTFLSSNALLIGLSTYDLQKRDKHPKWRNITGWASLTLGIMGNFTFIIGRNDLKKVKEERTKLQKQLDYQQNRRRRGALSSGEEDSME